jgi:hypothetical protein
MPRELVLAALRIVMGGDDSGLEAGNTVFPLSCEVLLTSIIQT